MRSKKGRTNFRDLKPAVRESVVAPTNYVGPDFFRPRYSKDADDFVVPEDVPKGTAPDAVMVGERELDSNPKVSTQILDQRNNEFPLDPKAQAKLTPS